MLKSLRIKSALGLVLSLVAYTATATLEPVSPLPPDSTRAVDGVETIVTLAVLTREEDSSPAGVLSIDAAGEPPVLAQAAPPSPGEHPPPPLPPPPGAYPGGSSMQ